jgi:Lrp/AsnC family leucine-responsive transcriptional regulator
VDAIDRTLLRSLAIDGRVSFTRLAESVGLSSPSTAERVRRLEQQGAIVRYTGVVDPRVVGSDLTAFVAVTLASPSARDGFIEALVALPEVVECHHVAGEDDYLLKVCCEGTAGLERLVGMGLKAVPGVLRTRSTIVLSSTFERPFVPCSG